MIEDISDVTRVVLYGPRLRYEVQILIVIEFILPLELGFNVIHATIVFIDLEFSEFCSKEALSIILFILFRVFFLVETLFFFGFFFFVLILVFDLVFFLLFKK